MTTTADVVIVGGGAAGLMAGIQAARAQPRLRILLVDSRARPGAKILVSGGGRCNLTNALVGRRDFHSGNLARLEAVLQAFPVEQTLAFFRDIGLAVLTEDNGRCYPASQRANDVLDALLAEAGRRGLQWVRPWPVERVVPLESGFRLESGSQALWAPRLILATGGRSLPRSGSDGSGYGLAEQLGLHIRGPLVPGLSPLCLPDGHALRELAGISVPVSLRLGSARWSGNLLCTHFGISGPVVLDASREVLRGLAQGSGQPLCVDWLPGQRNEELRARLAAPAGSRRVLGHVQGWLPGRLASTLLQLAGVDESLPLAQLDRRSRERLVLTLKELELPVLGARSWHHAECTAGGVDMDDLNSHTLEALTRPGLHVCGELCDVDGRLGGFNFQWAWSSGAVAGRAAARGDRNRRDDVESQ